MVVVSGITLRMYAMASVCMGVMVILHAWMQHEQFYPTLVGLANSKLALIVLSNVVIAACCGFGLGIQRFFLGKLRENEYEYLSEKAYPMLLDLLLTVTLFRMSLSASFFFMLGVLVVSKSFHWLVSKRVEYMGQFPMTPLSHYVRMGVFMVLLVLLDALVVIKSVKGLWNETNGFSTLISAESDYEGPSMFILYGFEFSVLCVMMLGTMARSGLTLWELLRHSGRWDEKSTFIMYSDFISDVFQFVIYTLFFLTLYACVGLPFTLVRPLLVAFSNFRKRVADLLRYRQATQNMELRFPEATAEELASAHNMCIICREDMTQGRKLPCGHVLHLRCLREWLEHQQTCPTCRMPVLDEPPAAREPQNPFPDFPPGAPANDRVPLQPHAMPHPHAVPNPPGPFGPLPPPIHPYYQLYAPFPHHPNFFLQQPPFAAHLAPLAQPPAPPQAPAAPSLASTPVPAHTPSSTSPAPSSLPTSSTATSSTATTVEDTSSAQNPNAESSLPASSSPLPVASSSHTPSSSPLLSSLPASTHSHEAAADFFASHNYLPQALPASLPYPPELAHDIRDLVTSINRDLDSLRSRMDVLTALLNANAPAPLLPTNPSSSSTS